MWVICCHYKVGGIPEVLPNEMTSFAEPEENSLIDAAIDAINKKSNEIDTSKFHDAVAKDVQLE